MPHPFRPDKRFREVCPLAIQDPSEMDTSERHTEGRSPFAGRENTLQSNNSFPPTQNLAIDVLHLALSDLGRRLREGTIVKAECDALNLISKELSELLDSIPSPKAAEEPMFGLKLRVRTNTHPTHSDDDKNVEPSEPVTKSDDAVANPEEPMASMHSDITPSSPGNSRVGSSAPQACIIPPWFDPLLQVFREIDKDGNGAVTGQELRRALKLLSISPARAARIMMLADEDHSEEIDFVEWCRIGAAGDADMEAVGTALLARGKGKQGNYLPEEDEVQRRYILQPFGKIRIVWDFLVVLTLMYIAIMWPFFGAFGALIPSHTTTSSIIVDQVVNAIFVSDMLLNFRTAIFSDTGELVTSPKLIAKNYLSTWFALDFVSTIPIGDLADTELASRSQAIKLVRVTRILRLLKILKPRRGVKSKMYDLLDEAFAHTVLPHFFRRINLIFTTFLLCHWLACGAKFASQGFIENYRDVGGDLNKEYIASWYFAMTTMSTVGYGDIVPQSDVERLFCVVAMVLGGSFYGYVVGSISSMVANHDLNTSAYYDRLDLIGAWLAHNKFPRDIRRRVRKYFKDHLQQKSAIDDGTIVDELSGELREAVGHHLVSDEIKHHYLFNGISLVAMVHLQKIVQKGIIGRGTMITKRGDQGTAMYIIDTGTILMEKFMKVREPGQHSKVTRTLSAGDSFGEEVLLELEELYTYTTKALSASVVFIIPCSAFFDLFKTMPSVTKQLRANATTVVQRQARIASTKSVIMEGGMV